MRYLDVATDMQSAADALRGRRPDIAARLDAHVREMRRQSEGPRPLTVRQHQLYVFLWDFIAANGYAPSFAEIAEHFLYNSLATVHEHVTNLERKGWIRRSFNEVRALECLVPLPLKSPAALRGEAVA